MEPQCSMELTAGAGSILAQLNIHIADVTYQLVTVHTPLFLSSVLPWFGPAISLVCCSLAVAHTHLHTGRQLLPSAVCRVTQFFLPAVILTTDTVHSYHSL